MKRILPQLVCILPPLLVIWAIIRLRSCSRRQEQPSATFVGDYHLPATATPRSPYHFDTYTGSHSFKMSESRIYSVSGRKKSVAEEPVTSVLAANEIPVYERELTADEEVLAALGYKPEFRREFNLWTTFCVSFAVLGLLPSFASTLYYVRIMEDKGPSSRD